MNTEPLTISNLHTESARTYWKTKSKEYYYANREHVLEKRRESYHRKQLAKHIKASSLI
jgi:hypothetical protein